MASARRFLGVWSLSQTILAPANRLNMRYLFDPAEAATWGSGHAAEGESVHLDESHEHKHEGLADGPRARHDGAHAWREVLLQLPHTIPSMATSFVAQVKSTRSFRAVSSNVGERAAMLVGGVAFGAMVGGFMFLGYHSFNDHDGRRRSRALAAPSTMQTTSSEIFRAAYSTEVSMISSVTDPKHSRSTKKEEADAVAEQLSEAPSKPRSLTREDILKRMGHDSDPIEDSDFDRAT